MNEQRNRDALPPSTRERRRLPDGYRQGLITAITVLLGFSLAFLRFWGLESAGDWTLWALLSTGIAVLAVLLQLVALFRALQPEDDEEPEYRRTVKWFIASAVILLIGFLFALVEASVE